MGEGLGLSELGPLPTQSIGIIFGLALAGSWLYTGVRTRTGPVTRTSGFPNATRCDKLRERAYDRFGGSIRFYFKEEVCDLFVARKGGARNY